MLGLNFNCVEGVIPSCTSETNPPKYEPISCGDCKLQSLKSQRDCPDFGAGCQLRFKLHNDEMKEKLALQAAPSAVIIAAN
jgi:hypothetical protein